MGPNPHFFVHTRFSGELRIGPLEENSAEPFILNSCRQQATIQEDSLVGADGDIIAEGVGNRELRYIVEVTQLAQYGASDAFLGRIDHTLLSNVSKVFGVEPAENWCVLTGGTRTLRPGKLAEVTLEIKVSGIGDISAGSPDGPGTSDPGEGIPSEFLPAWVTTGPIEWTKGLYDEVDLSATGAPPLAFSVKVGDSLPEGLYLTPTGKLMGTIEYDGESDSKEVTFVVTNPYGSAEKKLTFDIAAGTAPATEIEVYVLYLVDSGVTSTSDKEWCLGYHTFSQPIASASNFLAAIPGGVVYDTDSPVIANPDALTGTVGEDTAWQIQEIYGRMPDGTWQYWYQRKAGVSKIKDVLDGEDNPIEELSNVEADPGDDIGVIEGSWPPTITPSDRFTQYFKYRDEISGEIVVKGLGGMNAAVDETALIAKKTTIPGFPHLTLTWTETESKVLIEFWDDVEGYIYQADVGDTSIDDTVTTHSPVYYLSDPQPSGPKDVGWTTLPKEVPSFAELDLPDPPDPPLKAGPAPAATTTVYALYTIENGTNMLVAWKFSNGPDFVGTLERQLARPNITLDQGEVTELHYGTKILKELWVKVGGDWKCRWLPPGLTSADSKIGLCLASGLSPLNHPSVGPAVSDPRGVDTGYTQAWPSGW